MNGLDHDCKTPAECSCGSAGCMICDGGLSLCKVCGALEGSLTKECPGERVPMSKQDRVYAGEIEYVGGRWVDLRPCSACAGTGRSSEEGTDLCACFGGVRWKREVVA